MSDVIFPNLGIEISNLNPIAFNVFGIEVYWYGIIIVTGIFAGLFAASINAKRTNQNPEIYMDLLMYAVVFAIIFARLYYVVFSWDEYKNDLMKIFAFREGGLAIYGGIIGAVLTLYVFCKFKKANFWIMADTAAPGLILGQAIGRWGNFFNMEAFGGYTDGLFSMWLKASKVKYIPKGIGNELLNEIEGIKYLAVHPTFLYESLWSIVVFIILMMYLKKKKFDGEIFFLYLLGYSLGRLWIEGLRTDQLILGSTGIAVSQLLALILVIISSVYIVYKRKKIEHQ